MTYHTGKMSSANVTTPRMVTTVGLTTAGVTLAGPKLGLHWTVSLALSDETFLNKWAFALAPDALPKGPMRFLMMAALEHWSTYHQLMDWAAYIYYVDNSVDDEDLHESYRQVFSDLEEVYSITESSMPTAWKAAEHWIQSYHIGMALDNARAFLVAGDRASAFSELLGLREVTGQEKSPAIEISGDADLAELVRQGRLVKKSIPLGIPQIDERLEGGVTPGELAIIAGPTNLGKSMFLCYLASEAYKRNQRVLYLTLELSRLMIGERILTALFQKPRQELDPDTITDELMFLREKEGVTDRGSVLIEDGVETVVDLIDRLEKVAPDIVLIDSADDLKPKEKYKSLYESQGEVYSHILLSICHEMNMPVWTSVQLNRDSIEKGRVSLRHIGDSFKKVQRATLVIGLSQTLEEAEHHLGNMMKLLCLKDTQHGAQGKWWRYLVKFGNGPRGWPAYSYYPETGALS